MERLKSAAPFKEPLYSILKQNNAILAGGALTSLYSKREISDYDFFLPTQRDWRNCFLQFHRIAKNRVLNGNIINFHLTTKAITYTIGADIIQLIRTVYGTPEEIINSFDLSVAKAAYDLQTGQTVYGKNFHNDLKNNIARVEKWDSNPCVTIARLRKYHDLKGFKLLESDIIKLGILLQVKGGHIMVNRETMEEEGDFHYNRITITPNSAKMYIQKWLEEMEEE